MNQTIITDLLPSRQLRDAIRATCHRFTERELVCMAEQYAPTRDALLGALAYLAEHCEDPGQRQLAEHRLRYHREALERLLSPEPDTVYAAELREFPDSYTEHYLCKTFEAAIKAIRGFCEAYTVAFNDLSSIEINQYRVLDEVSDFAECELGTICLTKDLAIARADYWSLEETYREAYGSVEGPIVFPDALESCSPVVYRDIRGMEYGMQIKALREGPEDDAFVIALDSDSVNAEDLSGFFNAHLHVPIPRLEQLTPDDLPQRERRSYLRLADYLRGQGII